MEKMKGENIMNIKDILINKGIIKEKVPKVIIEEKELLVKIGRWLGVLPFVINEPEITKKQLEEINYRFGLLLKQTGILENETCILNNYNLGRGRNFNFTCNQQEKNTNKNIEMYFGDDFDNCYEFEIESDKDIKRYDHFLDYDGKKDVLNLVRYGKKIINNPNKSYSYKIDFDDLLIETYIEEEQISIIIEITNNEYINTMTWYKYFDFNKLEEIFSKDDFIPTFEDALILIKESSIKDISNYKKIKITLTSKKDIYEVEIQNGELTKLQMKKDNKKLTLEDINEQKRTDTNIKRIIRTKRK